MQRNFSISVYDRFPALRRPFPLFTVLRVLLTLFLTLLFTAAFTGCTNTAVHPTDLLKQPLDAEMTITANGIEYRVSVHLGAVTECGTRDCEICLLSPDSLKGIVLSAQNGIKTLSLGDRQAVLSEHASQSADTGFFLAAALLSPGDTALRRIETADGKSILNVHLTDGRVLSIDPTSGQLLSVVKGDITAEITWIESRERSE